MATQEQVIAALGRHFNGLVDGLFTVAETGRVLGYVQSPDFEEIDHQERQERLWAAINAEFRPEEQQNLGPITTMTPDEARLHIVDAD